MIIVNVLTCEKLNVCLLAETCFKTRGSYKYQFMWDRDATVLNSSSLEIDVFKRQKIQTKALKWNLLQQLYLVSEFQSRNLAFFVFKQILGNFKLSVTIQYNIANNFFQLRHTNLSFNWNVSTVVLLTAYATSSPAKDTCQKACTADYSPICGKPAEGKGTDITFGNKCVLDNYNCEKKDKREFLLEMQFIFPL